MDTVNPRQGAPSSLRQQIQTLDWQWCQRTPKQTPQGLVVPRARSQDLIKCLAEQLEANQPSSDNTPQVNAASVDNRPDSSHAKSSLSQQPLFTWSLVLTEADWILLGPLHPLPWYHLAPQGLIAPEASMPFWLPLAQRPTFQGMDIPTDWLLAQAYQQQLAPPVLLWPVSSQQAIWISLSEAIPVTLRHLEILARSNFLEKQFELVDSSEVWPPLPPGSSL